MEQTNVGFTRGMVYISLKSFLSLPYGYVEIRWEQAQPDNSLRSLLDKFLLKNLEGLALGSRPSSVLTMDCHDYDNLGSRSRCRTRRVRAPSRKQRSEKSQHGSRRKKCDSSKSSLVTLRDTSVLLMPNAGERLGCLLNQINQQLEQRSSLWSSRLLFPTKEGYRTLPQIQARRLKALLALAYYLDEKDTLIHKKRVNSTGSSLSKKSSDETIDL
ncbi:hypothetical protein Mapa_014837 [Marchantia paleacea]|nr:hypothetical protein Mapa_014837 [Marchantia paleacea]